MENATVQSFSHGHSALAEKRSCAKHLSNIIQAYHENKVTVKLLAGIFTDESSYSASM